MRAADGISGCLFAPQRSSVQLVSRLARSWAQPFPESRNAKAQGSRWVGIQKASLSAGHAVRPLQAQGHSKKCQPEKAIHLISIKLPDFSGVFYLNLS